MGSKTGYEYNYRFWVDDDIFCRYRPSDLIDGLKFLFEIRTKFRVKGEAGDEIIDSEMYEFGVGEKFHLLFHLIYDRLDDYWFSFQEIWAFFHKASAFAQEMAGYGRNGVIPIAVELDVCSVQQPGETFSGAMDRAIKSENLYPLFLMYDRNSLKDVEESPFGNLIHLLRGSTLYPMRVYDVGLMSDIIRNCPVCQRDIKIGDQITVLKDYCNHALHYHCLVRSLLNDPSCPICSHRIDDDDADGDGDALKVDGVAAHGMIGYAQVDGGVAADEVVGYAHGMIGDELLDVILTECGEMKKRVGSIETHVEEIKKRVGSL